MHALLLISVIVFYHPTMFPFHQVFSYHRYLLLYQTVSNIERNAHSTAYNVFI